MATSAKMKKVLSTLTKVFICERCVKAMKKIFESAEEVMFYDKVELVKSFCYLGQGCKRIFNFSS